MMGQLHSVLLNHFTCTCVVGMHRVHWLAIVCSFTVDTMATLCSPTRLYLTWVRISDNWNCTDCYCPEAKVHHLWHRVT